MSDFSIITPHGAFLVWNYSDRMGADKTVHKQTKVDQLIISTLSLKSMSTNKSKSGPNGTFEVRLAPTKNWVQVLTPGSWCTMLMSRSTLTREDIDYANPKAKAHKYKIKMFGRIDSVRVSVSVDQVSGAKITEYIVTGVDWGSIFNSTLLVDPAMAMDAKNTDLPFGYLTQLIYNKSNKSQLEAGAQSTFDNLKVVLSMWGADSIDVESMIVKPEVTFSLPEEVVKFFNFKSSDGSKVNNIADLLHIYHGALEQIGNDPLADKYDGFEESYGLIQGEDVLNQNNLWNIINAIGNNWINEFICDLRWEDDQPHLALYKRIKPFIIDRPRLTRDNIYVGDNAGALLDKDFDKNISEYKNLRKIEIPLKEIISINAGTNWNDKVNFIEIKPSDPNMAENIAPLLRLKSQFYDKNSFAREGLRPFNARPRFYPEAVIRPIKDSIVVDGKTSNEEDFINEEVDKVITVAQKREVRMSTDIRRDKNEKKNYSSKEIDALTSWKYLLKEWYFDVHKMLNGSISFFGQDQYIQVGDNLIFDAKILGIAENMNLDLIKHRGKAYMLVHVESISHTFTVDNGGARHFATNVNFVRGILTDEKGAELRPTNSYGTLDQDVEKIGIYEEINYHNTTTKTYTDPD